MKPNKAGYFWGKYNNFPNKQVPYHLIIRITGEPPWLRIETIIDFQRNNAYDHINADTILHKIEWGSEIERPELL